MTTPIARTGDCLCGARVAFHFDDRNAKLTCEEARLRQFTFGDQPPRSFAHSAAELRDIATHIEPRD